MRLGFFIYYPIISHAIIAYPFPEYPMQKLHSSRDHGTKTTVNIVNMQQCPKWAAPWGACARAGPPIEVPDRLTFLLYL